MSARQSGNHEVNKGFQVSREKRGFCAPKKVAVIFAELIAESSIPIHTYQTFILDSRLVKICSLS